MTVRQKRRPRIVALRELKAAVQAEAPLSPADMHALALARPRTRSDCEGGLRPCPFVSCKYNLYLDIAEPDARSMPGAMAPGHIKLNFPEAGPEAMGESCALDVAERGGITLEAIGGLLNLTRERARQIQEAAFQHIRKAGVDFEAPGAPSASPWELMAAEAVRDLRSENGAGRWNDRAAAAWRRMIEREQGAEQLTYIRGKT
jgi:hypothetical protein